MHAHTIEVGDYEKHEVDVLAGYPVAAKMDSCLEHNFIKSTLKESCVSLIILSLEQMFKSDAVIKNEFS